MRITQGGLGRRPKRVGLEYLIWLVRHYLFWPELSFEQVDALVRVLVAQGLFVEGGDGLTVPGVPSLGSPLPLDAAALVEDSLKAASREGNVVADLGVHACVYSPPATIVNHLIGRPELEVHVLSAGADMLSGYIPKLQWDRALLVRALEESGVTGPEALLDGIRGVFIANAKRLQQQAGLEQPDRLLACEMHGVEVGDSLQGGTAPAGALMDGEFEFLREGRLWRITFEGERVRVKDLVGLAFLHQLVIHQAQAVHVRDLLGGAPESPAGSDAVSDAEAVRAYKARAREIAREIEECRAGGEADELDALLEELGKIEEVLRQSKTPKGLRQMPSVSDKERQRCGQALRRALRHLKKEMPACGKHFWDSVRGRTGWTPMYLPVQRVPWFTH